MGGGCEGWSTDFSYYQRTARTHKHTHTQFNMLSSTSILRICGEILMYISSTEPNTHFALLAFYIILTTVDLCVRRARGHDRVRCRQRSNNWHFCQVWKMYTHAQGQINTHTHRKILCIKIAYVRNFSKRHKHNSRRPTQHQLPYGW